MYTNVDEDDTISEVDTLGGAFDESPIPQLDGMDDDVLDEIVESENESNEDNKLKVNISQYH